MTVSPPDKGKDGTWKTPGILSRLNEVAGGGEIGTVVLGAGAAMMAAGVATAVLNFGITQTATTLNNLQPAQTPNLMAGLGRGGPVI